nr:ATP-binding protein [uncultured Arsenicibacter sp.]
MKRFIYLFLLIPYVLIAQQLPLVKGWQELTISDGLSQGMVFDMKQDRKGFIWVATKDGLNRYDGYNFKVYTPDTYDDYSLSDENCTSLLIDRHGRLWVGTLSHGIDLVDVKTDRFYHLNIRDQTAGNAGNYEIRWMSEDPEGHILVSTNKNKLFRITLPSALQTGFPATANFTGEVKIDQFTLPASDYNGQVYGGVTYAVYHPDGQATLGSTFGMYRFNWRHPDGLIPVNRVMSPSMNLDASSDAAGGGYWFSSTISAVHGWYKGEHRVIPLPAISRKSPSKIVFINAGQVAVFSGDLLWIMSPADLYEQPRLEARNAAGRLPQPYIITSVLVDQAGLVWIGTAGYGLRKFQSGLSGFRSFLPGQSLSYLMQDRQKRTYVRQGYYFDEADFTSNRLVNMENPPIGLPVPLKHYIVQDRQGAFRVLIDGDTPAHYDLLEYSSDWKLRKRIPVPAGIRAGEYVGTYALEDRQGQLWFGMANGQLMRFNPVTAQFRVYSYASLLPEGGTSTETYFLHFDRDGTLWVCTNKGLIRMQKPLETPLFSLYTKSKTDPNSLSHDVVSCALDDPYEPDRYLWVSTKGGGLNRLEKKTGRFSHVTEADGLPNKVVYGMLPDDFRNIWMSTNRGIARFNPQSRVFHSYTKSDGLQDDEFNTASFLKSATGELLFGGVNGVTIFNPRDILSRSATPPVARLIGLLVNNKPVRPGDDTGILPENIAYTQRIDLDHDQDILTLEFGLSDYRSPAKNRYRYRLGGVNAQWVESGVNRFANYTHLPDGAYTFEMTGSTDGEVWSKPVTLQIRVHPPFYRTWWAYLLYVVVISMVVLQAYRIQTQRLLLQQQVAFEQQEAGRLAGLDALKTRFFTNISHEFRTPLTLILGPLGNRKNKDLSETELSMMERNGRRLLSLINQLLDLSKLEAGNMQVETTAVDVASFIRTLASSYTSMAVSKSIQFAFDQQQTSYWAYADRDKLEKILTNLLSNAFKFTPTGGTIRMEVAYPPEKSMLELTVSDTGIGIPAEQLPKIFDRFYQAETSERRSYEGTGIGLALVHELVTVLKGTVSVTSTEGQGTAFRVVLPLAPAAAPDVYVPPVLSVQPEEALSGPPDSLSEVTTPAGAPPEKILLIIDDNADIRTYLRTIFEDEYVIMEAEDGQQGLEKATDVTPDLVICDLMMPRLDGFGFCRIMKTQVATSHIPVVMLTAKATVQDRIEGFGLGADEYLTKPFDATEIRVRVRNLIRQRERLGQYFQERLGLTMAPAPGNEQLIATENDFLERVQAAVDARLADGTFDVEQLSQSLNLSQRQLVRKLKALTGQTAVEFIRNRRLEQSALLIRQGNLSIAEVAYQVGFESPSYFSRIFQEKFGVLPSAYSGEEEKT